jgi:3-dehydroquinate synthase
MIEADYVDRMKKILISAGLPVTVPDLDTDQLIELMRHDKKNTQGNIVFVLPTAPGQVEVFQDVTEETIIRALEMTR